MSLLGMFLLAAAVVVGGLMLLLVSNRRVRNFAEAWEARADALAGAVVAVHEVAPLDISAEAKRGQAMAADDLLWQVELTISPDRPDSDAWSPHHLLARLEGETSGDRIVMVERRLEPDDYRPYEDESFFGPQRLRLQIVAPAGASHAIFYEGRPDDSSPRELVRIELPRQ